MARLIIGHTTHNSVKIWVRGSARWPVAFLDVRDSAGRRKGQTQSLSLLEDSFYTGIIYWSNLSPNRPYSVHLSFAKTEDDSAEDRVRDAYTTGHFTTFPIPDAKSEFAQQPGMNKIRLSAERLEATKHQVPGVLVQQWLRS